MNSIDDIGQAIDLLMADPLPAEQFGASLLALGESILVHWLMAHGQDPTTDEREGFRLLALHRQGTPVSLGSSRPVPTSWEELAARAANDFEEVVPQQHPSVAEALAALRATRPLLALLAGSGGACFALYLTVPEAEQARRTLPALTGSRIFPIHTLAAWQEWG